MNTTEMNEENVRDPPQTVVGGEGGRGVLRHPPQELAGLRDTIAGDPAVSGVVVFVRRDRIEGRQWIEEDG
ncbi:MAG: hypothetical protein JXA08_00710 [Methanomicrobiaceae archaeon]|nr:hypothetical protein [Methanomicrobiaceae archaeon]